MNRFVNVIAGAEATVIFGVTFALLGYVRQATTGLVIGLDGRAARDTASRLVDITRRAIWVQSIWVTFGTVAIILLSEPLIGTLMPAIVDLQQQQIANLLGIMIFGMAVRATGDCWIKILNVAGHAPQFGLVLFVGVLVYLVALATTLGFGQPYVAAAYLFCTVQAVLFGVVLPDKLSHVIEIPVWRLLALIAVTLGPVTLGPVALCVLSRG